MPLRKKNNLLREYRRQSGLSGYDLQLLSGISAQAIYLIERGLKRPQRYEKALLSQALSTEEEKLFPNNLERCSIIER